jgi:PAS domain S-box-containing protein
VASSGSRVVLDGPNRASESVALEGFVDEREDLFRLLVESVRDYAIFMLDPQGRVATWNPGAQKMKGYTREEILGQDFSIFYPPDAVARRWPQLELALARDRGRFEDEGWRLRKDGTRFWANVVIAPMMDAQQRLRGFAKVTRDLTARRQVEALQRTERRMNEFLAMLAHELRNPLAPIRSALDVLERKPADPEVSDWAHAVIDRQSRQLSHLVDDLLDVSRITRGKIALNWELVDLRDAIERVTEALRPIIKLRRQTLELVLPDAPLPVRADATRLEQIIANLLNNANKYTQDGGRISVRAAAIGEIASVTISDNGVGMSPDLVPRVFELFVQGERGLDRRGGGLGVGLTLAKRLTELLNGSLTASSPGPGLGSEFTLAFPMSERVAEPSQASSEEATPAVETKRRRILIVDDNQDAAESLAALLEILGHQTIVLHDGPQALNVAASHQPDMVLLDIGLPGMDGIEVARRLRSMPELNGTRFIACTGYGREDDARRIDEAGFHRHLVKPVSAADLQRILAE